MLSFLDMTLKLLTLPVSTNHIYLQRGSARFLDPRARRCKEAIGWEARSQYRGKPLTGPLAVSVALFWPDRRKHDVDNIKVLLDALTGIAWEDDGQIVELHTSKAYDKAKPRVELTVSAYTVPNASVPG
jgi:Holliday junction resolvase RusA-like endonuclease